VDLSDHNLGVVIVGKTNNDDKILSNNSSLKSSQMESMSKDEPQLDQILNYFYNYRGLGLGAIFPICA
jgi:hypothetical protein